MPSAFNRRVTSETATTELAVLDGELPSDVAGHVLFQSLALLSTDAGLAGDSLIWRVDLDGDRPRITSKILHTADYEIARAFEPTGYRFESRGLTRVSALGLQNQTNTALVRIDGNRLLATVDGGRPWELDPATLRPVTPVGRLDEYRAMLELRDLNRFICPLNITSAHPPYDPRTGEYYGINFSMVPLPGMDYCEVLRWDGAGALDRVPLVLPDGSPVWISQSAHQMCISREHLVIVDAAVTIEGAKLTNDANSGAAGWFQPPRADTHLYLVRRDDLRSTNGRAVARRAVIARESGHLMVDYDNEPGRIVVHSAHTAALDVGEWAQPYDIHPMTGAPMRADLVNAPVPISYDLGVVGRYEIDTTTGAVVDQRAFCSDWTWGTGGLTAANPLAAGGTVGDVFHANSGHPTDLAVRRMAVAYTNYRYRLVPMDELPWDGVPSSLVRYDHDDGRTVDGYFYPGDRFGWTPTFIPRRGTATGADDGYVIAVVYGDDATERSAGTELWLFDASDLARGPVTKLGLPDLQMPLTLHSIWLDTLTTSRPDYRVDVASELLERARTWYFDPSVEATIRNVVIPAYEAAVG